MSEQPNTFDSWAIVELMGHVRLAGRVTEESHFGAALGRIDIPTAGGFVTQYFGGSSVYRITPTTEEIARAVAAHNQPQPAHRWELPQVISFAEEPDDEDIRARCAVLTGYARRLGLADDNEDDDRGMW